MVNHEGAALTRVSPEEEYFEGVILSIPGGEVLDGSDDLKNENEKKNSNKGSLIEKYQIFEPWGPYLLMWNRIFLWSWVIGVSTDPLLYYVRFINEERKCVATDNKLKIVALVFRSVTDVIYIIHIVFQVQTKILTDKIPEAKSKYKTETGLLSRKVILWLYIVFDILAVLPLPQTLTLSRMWGSTSTSSNTKKILNLLVLFQYVPKIVRIYQSCEELKTTPSLVAAWLMGLLHLFLYFSASHAVGAFWYFFAVQRQRDCWDYACQNQSGCVASTFDCSDNKLRNVTFLNQLCPTNPPNATVFDFGIFLDALQSGMLSSTDFPKKFLHCFWWGLRNLSSFGQNLETGTSVWDTYFAALICIIGLILFIYLLGNLQLYMQGATTRSEKIRQRMKSTEEEIDFWIYSNGFPKNVKPAIMHLIHQCRLDQEKDFDLNQLLSFLRQRQKQGHQTSEFQMDPLRNTYLKLVSLDKKLTKKIRARDVEMWVLNNKIPEDMREMIVHYAQCKLHEKDVNLENLLPVLPVEYRDSIKKRLCLDALNNVEVFKKLDEKGLKIIYDHLKPVVYEENSNIITEGEPLEFMLFVTHGTVWTFETSKRSEERNTISVKPLHEGELYGEEVLNWSMRFGSYSNYPVSTKTVKSHTKVEAFVLKAKDMKAVASKSWTLFRKLPRSTQSNAMLYTSAAASAIQDSWRSHQRKRQRFSI